MKTTGRYELKYIVEEDRAVAIADYVRAFMRPTAHSSTNPGPIRGHPVMSLYLDSPDYFLYRQVSCGLKNRLKLRIRFYNEHWHQPAFLEVKRRVNDNIIKDRVMVSRECVRQFLRGNWPNPSHWPITTNVKKAKYDVYFKFWQLCNALKARPIMYVSYLREGFEPAYESESRVTFDRQVAATPYNEAAMLDEDLGKLMAPTHGIHPRPEKPPYLLPIEGVVVELKYEERAPNWMFDLARIFNLHRLSMCKYAASVDGMMLQWGKYPLPQDERALTLRGYDKP